MLASELVLQGVRTVVLEPLAAPSDVMKAGGVNVITVDAFARRELAGALMVASEETSAAFLPGIKGRRRMAGHFSGLFKLDTSHLDPADPDVTAYPVATGITPVTQQHLERILEERAQRLGVEVRRACGLADFVHDERGVTVRTTTGETIRASWLVGCDGGRSTVRKGAGFEFVGTDPTFTGHQALVDIDRPDELGTGWIRVPDGMYAHGPARGRIITIEFDGPPPDRQAPVSAMDVETSLRRLSGKDIRITALHQATRWTDNARQATTYRIGRVLLAGDAAHVHSPLGGQGLNLGIGDAMNLGWKLAATVRGTAPAGLLDTYPAERHPVGERVLQNTRAQVALMRPGPHVDALRAVVADVMDTSEGNAFFTKMITGMTHNYAQGPHPMIGRRAPDLSLGDGRKVTELSHDGAAVLLDLADSAELREQVQDTEIRVITTSCAEFPELTGVLIRPDGYVAWATEQLRPEGLADAVTDWFRPTLGDRPGTPRATSARPR
jgi:2-polyprenyl-6-methoxyphenol hydroxylase-like FAD-dependent oxidoreductase